MHLNASDKFALELTSGLIDLSRLTRTVQRRVVSMLRVLEADLVRKIESFDLEGELSPSVRRLRTNQLIGNVRKIIRARYGMAAKRLEMELRELAVLTHEQAVAMINEVFSIDIVGITLTRADLKALVSRDVVLGEPTRAWWRGQAEGTRRRFAREMRLGSLSGETNAQLIRRVRGGPTGRNIMVELANGKVRRVREFSGGLMDASRREAEALVRTSMQSISNNTLLTTYKENDDIIKGVEAVTTLDGRTSDICMARTGAAWDNDGNALPESSVSEGFPGPPPWHWQCRSTLAPITKSWAELVEEASGDPKQQKLLDTVPNSTRVSMDGLVGKEVKTFDDWLRIKGDTFAQQKLGPARFKLWKDGKLTTSQLINSAGKPRNLKQIRQAVGSSS